MTRVRSWWIVIPAFVIGGALIGRALPGLQVQARDTWSRPGLAAMFVVNAALPLLVIVLSAICARLWTALLGTLLMIAGFLLATGQLSSLSARGMPQLHPLFVVSCLIYLVLAAGTVLALRLFFRGRRGAGPAA